MTLAEVIPQVQSLTPQEKQQLLHLLVRELTPREEASGLVADATYPVWSPHEAYYAADVLLKALEVDKAANQ